MLITGEDLKLIREVESLSQEDLASIMGCSRSRLSRIESNLLEMSQSEWFELKSRYPALLATLSKQKSSFVESVAIKSKIPVAYKDGKFVSHRIGNYFESLIKECLGPISLLKFWEQEGIEPLFFHDRVRCYPFDLILRMIQWLRLGQILNDKKAIQEFVMATSQSQKWWGEKGKWVATHKGPRDCFDLIEDWSFFSQNHNVEIEKRISHIAITFYPKKGINKKLYFHDPIIGEFVGDWAEAWFKIFFGQEAILERKMEGEKWFFRIKFVVLQ